MSTSKRRLELGDLCSNDPVCAQHEPQSTHEHRFLLGAACHGCLLIAETSCEQHNDFLDRALVVPTVDNLGVEFFSPTLRMTDYLLQLADRDLSEIAAALRAHRLTAPITALGVQRFLADWLCGTGGSANCKA